MSTVKLNTENGSVTLVPEDGIGNSNVAIPRGGVGKVLQIKSVAVTQAIALAPGQMVWGDLGIEITITPSSANSKFLLMGDLQVGKSSFSAYFRFAGGNSGNFVGDAASNRPRVGAVAMPSDEAYSSQHITALSMVYLDSPNTTSPVTYKIQGAMQDPNRIIYVNRSGSDRDVSNYDPRTASSFTIMEIAE